jgi:hypothetical protein
MNIYSASFFNALTKLSGFAHNMFRATAAAIVLWDNSVTKAGGIWKGG